MAENLTRYDFNFTCAGYRVDDGQTVVEYCETDHGCWIVVRDDAWWRRLARWILRRPLNRMITGAALSALAKDTEASNG